MSFISPIPTDSNGNPRSTGSMQSLGKDDFLQLLVTKMRHQDPLSPMEDEAFISQLAEFSALEQMSNIATGIETSNQWDFMQMQSINNNMAAGLIGREIRASYEGVYYDQVSQPTVAFTNTEFASEMVFTIRDADGQVINRITETDVPTGPGHVTWDGKDQLGNRVEEGYYFIEATARTASGSTFTPNLSLQGVVESITYRDGAAYLDIGGTQIPLSDVQWIGNPTSPVNNSDDSNDDTTTESDDDTTNNGDDTNNDITNPEEGGGDGGDRYIDPRAWGN